MFSRPLPVVERLIVSAYRRFKNGAVPDRQRAFMQMWLTTVLRGASTEKTLQFAEYHCRIGAAETEGVGHRDFDSRSPRGVWDVVKIALRIRRL
jgi:hypothetical protein